MNSIGMDGVGYELDHFISQKRKEYGLPEPLPQDNRPKIDYSELRAALLPAEPNLNYLQESTDSRLKKLAGSYIDEQRAFLPDDEDIQYALSQAVNSVLLDAANGFLAQGPVSNSSALKLLVSG